MPKVITSPVKRWAGTVTLSDPLSYPQVFAWQDAIKGAQGIDDPMRINFAIIPGILKCVEKWDLSGISEHPSVDDFPATPPIASFRLISWLVSEISTLFSEAEEVPLES